MELENYKQLLKKVKIDIIILYNNNLVQYLNQGGLVQNYNQGGMVQNMFGGAKTAFNNCSLI